MAEALPISGAIDPTAFPFLLMDLHQQGATGSLKVDGPAYQKALYFRGGRVLFGSSNDPKDQLGAILIESDKITPEQLEEVNAKVGPGNPLAKVLADSGFVSQRELSEAARTKVERILSDIFSYATGSFEFEDGVLPKGAVDLKLVTERLVIGAVRRITDRNFVLRHLPGLDVVLAAKPDAPMRLAELALETGRLYDHLDGKRTLKDAAALTRLDEFEAAKVACALVFLGLAAGGERAAEPEPAPAPGDLLAGLDLGETVRDAVAAPRATEPQFLIAEEPPASLEPPVPAAAPPIPEPELEPPTLIETGPQAEPALPPWLPPPPPPRPEPVAAPEPATILLPPTPAAPEAAPGPAPPLSPSLFAAEEPPPAPQPAAPPSKDDLAALDALLHSRHHEGPLASLEKRPEPESRWEPRFGQPPAKRPRDAGGRRPRLLGLAAAIVLAVAAAAAWMFWPTPRRPARIAQTPSATAPAATVAPEIEPPATTLVATAAASAPAVKTATTAPAAARPATPQPAAPAGSLEDARGLLRKGELAGAARGFASNVKRASAGSFSVQILVACSDDTVHKAVQNTAAGELFILPVDYKGKSCYRLCWGLYDSEQRARAATSSVPEYFRKGGASPKAVAAKDLVR